MQDMVSAYRHTKAELFAERSIPSRLELLRYEKDLISNLKNLLRILHAQFPEDLLEIEGFFGQILQQPKNVQSRKNESIEDGDEAHIYVTDSKARWFDAKQKLNPECSFRTMAVPSIDFQILGVLWIMKAGHLLDAKLSPSCRGNLLRRFDEEPFHEKASTGEKSPINDESPNIFSPYYSAYRNWRQDGLDSIESEVNNNHRVIAITMDLRKYFHRIDPKAILEPGFWKSTFGINLDPTAWLLTRYLGFAMDEWASRAPEKTGIPVGLLASRVVANAILHEFDQAVSKKLNPTFYARYVDDILLVIQRRGDMSSAHSIIKYLKDQLGDIASMQIDSSTLKLNLQHVGTSLLEFGSNKQRIFDLQGQAGLDLLSTIKKQINALSSEFRLLPDLSEDDNSVLHEALVADHDLEVGADSLRKADSLTIRRMGLAILLRNHELLERCLASPKDWANIRDPFYKLIEDHVLTPERYCTYFQYLPRIFGLIASNGDWDLGDRLLKKIDWVQQEIDSISTLNEKNV